MTLTLPQATYLLLDDLAIDLAGRDVVVAAERDVEVPLVVAKVEICLSSVVQHEHLACTPQQSPVSLAEVNPARGPVGDPPCSVGDMVPASMFMYGSIFIAVTLKPSVLSSKPVDEADRGDATGSAGRVWRAQAGSRAGTNR